MRIPYGLRRDESGELVNNFTEQRSLGHDRNTQLEFDLPPTFAYRMEFANGIGARSTGSGNIWNSSIHGYRSRNASTLALIGGYRPTTAYQRTDSYMVVRNLDASLIANAKSDAPIPGMLSIKDYVVPLTIEHRSYRDKIAPRLWDNIRTLDTQIGVTIGESKETFGELLSIYKRLELMYRAFRKRDASQLRRLVQQYRQRKRYVRRNGRTEVATEDIWGKLGNPANLWMEFRYGLVPMWYDIQNIFSDLTKDARTLYKLYRMSAGHGEVRQISVPQFASGIPYALVRPELKLTVTERERYGYILYNKDGYQKVSWDGTMQAVDTLAEKGQLIIDPVSTVWELLPYSFVLDWFVPVGNALQVIGSLYDAVSIVDGYHRQDFVNPSMTLELKTSFFEDVTVSSLTADVSYHFPYKREFTDQFPLVQLTLDINVRSIAHMIDGLILITQRLKK